MRGLGVSAPSGEAAQQREAALAGDAEDDVFEDDPGRLLRPTPGVRGGAPKDRLQPDEAAQHVVDGDDRRGRDDDPPVEVEGEEGEAAEDGDVRLDAPAGEVNEERRDEGLTGGDGVARLRRAGDGEVLVLKPQLGSQTRGLGGDLGVREASEIRDRGRDNNR